MEPRNLYDVLGLPATETATGIRHAFRELAFHYHPERTSAQQAPFFRRISEAYRVLADHAERVSYDESLRRESESLVAPEARPTAGAQPESLIPGGLSLFRDFAVTVPSFEEIYARFLRSVTDPWHPKSQRVDALNLELLLSYDQAARGGSLPIGVPVFVPCRACHGSGYSDAFACRACDGRGILEDEAQVRILIPPDVPDGAVFRIPLEGLGIHGVYLELVIRVDAPRH